MHEINVPDLVDRILSNKQYFISGLCAWSYKLMLREIISVEECEFIKDLIEKLPTEYECPITGSYIYCWKFNDIKPRIEWLLSLKKGM